MPNRRAAELLGQALGESLARYLTSLSQLDSIGLGLVWQRKSIHQSLNEGIKIWLSTSWHISQDSLRIAT